MVTGHLQYEVVGTTRDDAAGEAFDKVARLLGLSYPGGPAISRAAENGNSSAFAFPRPMIDSGDLDFSFSGLKTAVLYTIREHSSEPEWIDQNRSDVAASFQAAVVETLAIKTAQALDKYEASTLLLAGGVAANKELRIALSNVASKAGVEMRVAPLGLCGDNAAMIGQIGSYAFSAGRLIGWKEADAVARRSIEDFSVQGSN